jgi:DNA-binding MarR family transcriptional regulator
MTRNAHITLSIPKELYEEMKKHKEINWSEVARNSIEEKLSEMKDITEGKELAKKLDTESRKILEEISKLSKKDWINYYRKMREREWKRTKSLTQVS